MPVSFRLTLAYDGTPFVGWQRQREGSSIQGLVEDALTRIAGVPVTVVGAGRTDAGVHARAQVASCQLDTAHDPATLRRALNAILPAEIRVTAVAAAPPGFHARHAAKAKTYRYRIVNGPLVLPFDRLYAWHVKERLDAAAMGEAAGLFEGEHDFAAFRGAGSSVVTSTRRVLSSTVETIQTSEGAEGIEIAYEVTATGFLRHMVRAMVGTLVEIGAGRRDVSSVIRALASGVRTDAGATAPAHGLCLVRVEYDAGISGGDADLISS